MQRLFSPKVVIVFRSQSWEVLTCHSLSLMFSSYLAMLSIFGSANAKCINMPPPNADKRYFLSWRLPVSSSGPGSSRRGKMYEN